MVSNKNLRLLKVSKTFSFKRNLLFLTLSLFFLFQSSNAFPQNSFNENQIKDFEKIIENWIEKNPKKVKQALDKLLAQEEKNHHNKTFEMLSDHSMDPVMGNPEGDVIVYEFFDYNCGYCKRVFSDLMDLVSEDSNLKIVLVELPVLGDSSIIASKAALASHSQGKYFQMHQKLIGHQGKIDINAIKSYASELELDIDLLIDDINKADTKYIEENYIIADKLGINGTPTFLIGNEIIPGALDKSSFKNLLLANYN